MSMRARLAAALCALVLCAVGACGSEEKFPDSEFEFGTEGGTLNPEDVRASPAEVSLGFAELATFVAEIAAATGSDTERAAGAQEKILPVWESILGTVKANDEATFRIVDDAFNALAEAISQGDSALAAQVAAEFTVTSRAYLVRFPATGASGSPAPIPTESASPRDSTSPTPNPTAPTSPSAAAVPGPGVPTGS
ncbi:MAG: hypothetical protein ACT4PP_07120 [Sporichthyaceae bacterium]